MQYVWAEGQDIFEKYPELKVVSEYSKLTDRQMKLVCLVADIKSPIKTLPDKQRRERACYTLNFPTEGNRLDKNGRNIVSGQVESIEKAIEVYKKNQYDSDRDTLDSLKQQIQEIKDYLKSDKSQPLIFKGKVVVDNKGKEKTFTDPKNLKLAAELGERLPGLVEAYKKVESILNVKEEKLQIPTFTSNDLPVVEEGDEPLSTLDQFMMNRNED